MKKYLFVTLMTLLLAVPVAGWCQGPHGNEGDAPQNDSGPGGPGGPGGQPDNPAQFQQRKSEILERISERQAELQKTQSCVEAASDGRAMRACMPHHGEGRTGGMQRNGMQGGGPGSAPMDAGPSNGQ